MAKDLTPFKAWNERYDADGYYYGTEPNDYLKLKEPVFSRASKILCLAEGEGRNAIFLAEKGHFCLAVDGSEKGLEKLKQLAASRTVQVETQCADLAEFEFEPNGYDVIVSIWCHLPPQLRNRVHAECVKALKPGGYFILESYIPRQLDYKTGGPPVAELMMTEEILRSDFKSLKIIECKELDREIQEGKGHSGMSAVVQFLGQKI